MPKYRKLHVKTVESLDVNDMPDDFHRLFWVLLPLGLCREGRGIDNTSWIKAKIFPLREDVSQTNISDAMNWFEGKGMIVRYDADGRKYFYVPSFYTYQGNTTKEADSDYPPPNSIPSQELVKSKSGVDKTKVAEDPYCILPTASEYLNTESKDTAAAVSSFHTPSTSPAKLYMEATGQGGIPSSQMDLALSMLQDVLDHYGDNYEAALTLCKKHFVIWCATKNKQGRGYPRTKVNWLEWVLEDLAPLPEGSIEKVETNEEILERKTQAINKMYKDEPDKAAALIAKTARELNARRLN